MGVARDPAHERATHERSELLKHGQRLAGDFLPARIAGSQEDLKRLKVEIGCACTYVVRNLVPQ